MKPNDYEELARLCEVYGIKEIIESIDDIAQLMGEYINEGEEQRSDM